CPDRYQLEPAECDVFCQVQGLPCRRAGARQPEPAASMESVLCRQAGCCTIVGIISVGMMPLTGSSFPLPMDPPVLSGLARRIVQEDLLVVQTAGRASKQTSPNKMPLISSLEQNKLSKARDLALVCAEEFGHPFL